MYLIGYVTEAIMWVLCSSVYGTSCFHIPLIVWSHKTDVQVIGEWYKMNYLVFNRHYVLTMYAKHQMFDQI